MKTLSKFALPLLFAGLFASCSKQETPKPQETIGDGIDISAMSKSGSIDYCGTPDTVRLLADEDDQKGYIVIGNDTANTYITVTATGNWKIDELYVYFGACESIPKSSGYLNPANFPYKLNYSCNYPSTYTYKLPLITGCNCASVKAKLRKSNNCSVDYETVWGEGDPVAPAASTSSSSSSYSNNCYNWNWGCYNWNWSSYCGWKKYWSNWGCSSTNAGKGGQVFSYCKQNCINF